MGQIEEIIEKTRRKAFGEPIICLTFTKAPRSQEGYKSVAYSITFRAADRTLEDKDVSAIMEKILKDLKEMGIELRA